MDREGKNQLVISWYFEPNQPQRITSELVRNFILSHSYSFHKSWYHKSRFVSLFIFSGDSTPERASIRVTYLILRACTGTSALPQLTQEQLGRSFGKNAGEWTPREEISKEEIPGSKPSMYGYILTYSRL